jgi:hypothetical protein
MSLNRCPSPFAPIPLGSDIRAKPRPSREDLLRQQGQGVTVPQGISRFPRHISPEIRRDQLGSSSEPSIPPKVTSIQTSSRIRTQPICLHPAAIRELRPKRILYPLGSLRQTWHTGNKTLAIYANVSHAAAAVTFSAPTTPIGGSFGQTIARSAPAERRTRPEPARNNPSKAWPHRRPSPPTPPNLAPCGGSRRLLGRSAQSPRSRRRPFPPRTPTRICIGPIPIPPPVRNEWAFLSSLE